MSLAQIKDEAERLSPTDQRELSDWLFALRTRGDEEFRRRLLEKIDDKNPEHWVELDELERRFAEQD